LDRDGTEADIEARLTHYARAVKILQDENQRQRSLPDCIAEHWGWIPKRHDRLIILRQIGIFANELDLPS
jgi:hypothetical protein